MNRSSNNAYRAPDSVICLWSGPRNVSTALMYAFRERPDTEVLDEPLYAHYLRVSGAIHPGLEQVMAAQHPDGDTVVQNQVLGPSDRPVRFVKHMAHHLVDLDLGFLHATRNVLLIRDPEQMLPSLINQIPQPTLRDTGLKRQCELFDDLAHRGRPALVLDARELLLNPASVLRRLCAGLELPFFEAMLTWPAGPKPEDGAWAPYWYHSVHSSTTFMPYREKQSPFPECLEGLLAECRPYYETLYAHALKADL